MVSCVYSYELIDIFYYAAKMNKIHILTICKLLISSINEQIYLNKTLSYTHKEFDTIEMEI